MSLESYDNAINEAVQGKRAELAIHFNATVIFYYGPLMPQVTKAFRDFIEGEYKAECDLASREKRARFERIVIVLNTPGGTAEAVEKMVEIIRHHYAEVFFIVPDHAMSAGTILCMSGDKIYMDYSSSLGPIDPQVPTKDGDLVPALGYLDQVTKLIEKSKKKTITGAELAMLQNLDLAMLSFYEQARELTVSLLKDWLARYKFKSWTQHRTDPAKKGQPVTPEEKTARAEEIAQKLSANSLWHSHGRYIGIQTVVREIRLEIEDYSREDKLREGVRGYHDLLVEYIRTKKLVYLMHGQTTT